jgi:hypothetical protein
MPICQGILCQIRCNFPELSLIVTVQIFEQSNHLLLVFQYLQVGLDHESGGDGDLFEVVF